MNPLVDVSCFVGSWPFRELPLSDPERLRNRLQANGVSHALVSPLEAVLHRSPRIANARWADRLAGDDFFTLVPVADPRLPGATGIFDDFPAARAIRVLPGAEQDRLGEFVAAAGEHDRTVIVQTRMIDARMDHPDLTHHEITGDTVRRLAADSPRTKIVVAGARMPEITALLEDRPANLWCEVSCAETASLFRRLIDGFGADPLLCGTHAPIHVVEALSAKLAGAELTETERDAISYRNAVDAGVIADRDG